MSHRGNSLPRRTALAGLALLLLADHALAYVGPGPGPEVIGYFLSLLTWVGVAFSAFLLWPLYAMRQWLRGGTAPPAEAAPVPPPTAALAGPAERARAEP